MDSLVPLAVEDWPKLRDRFRTFQPYGVAGFNLMDTLMKIREAGLEFQFTVYCPYGDVTNGMVVTISKIKRFQIAIMAISEDTSKLEEALLTTKLIDWNQTVEVPFVDEETRKCVDKVLAKKGHQLYHERQNDVLLFSRHRKPYENLRYPEGTYVAPVKVENIPQVVQGWPHRYNSCEWLFALLIKAGLSYGLYNSDDDSLMAWMFLSEVGFLMHLYCEEQHRRKGYAEFLVKYVTNDELARGNDVYCHVLKGNSKSLELFSKLGFEVIGKASWTWWKKSLILTE